MDIVKKFSELKERIYHPEPIKPEDNYKEFGFCQGQCDRKVIPDSTGKPMIVCNYCKRIVMKR